MLTKDQLIEIGRHYFETKKGKKRINLMYATHDGNFFYDHAMKFAESHAKTIKGEVITIKRAEVMTPAKTEKKAPPPPVVVDEELIALRREGKELKISRASAMGKKKLKKKIKEAKTPKEDKK